LLLGVVGNKKDCRKITAQINKFLKETLILELNLKKRSINLAGETLTSFLGFEIGRYLNKIDSKNVFEDNGNIKKLTQNAINSPSFLIPVKKILYRFCTIGYICKLPKSNRYKEKKRGGRITIAKQLLYVENDIDRLIVFMSRKINIKILTWGKS